MNLKSALTLKKRLPLLVGVLSLSLVAAAGIPSVLAQSNSPNQQPGRHQNWLNLTSDQEAKMQQIRQAEREQINNILTADQRSQLQSAGTDRGGMRQAFDSLNLTDDQRSQVESIRRNSREQMDAILTAEQRQQMQQHRPGPMGDAQLNLTADQQTQIDRIRQTERQQMDSILTSEQRTRLETARANRENPRQVFESLNLTADQRSRLDELRRNTREQIDAILTPEQRQQMQQHRPPRPDNGNGPNDMPPPPDGAPQPPQ
ncbi:MAG TPA: Spy/CpxP family protein refolding chaperone [Crinalium sp.]|jgi:Spy/CpxP family protein refolding chaperone